MELDITAFFNAAAPIDYSASVAEIGANAGPDTWRAACDDSADYPILDTEDKRDAFREFVRSSGGWTNEEIAAWSDLELNALCIQWISGDMREDGLSAETSLAEWMEYETDDSKLHRIFRAEDGRVYFYVGI